MAEIKIAGRVIPLVFDMVSWTKMDAEVCTLARINDVLSYGKENKTSTSIRELVSIMRILGNEGLEEAGQTPDLTDEWLLKKLRPAQVGVVRKAIIAVIDEAMDIETQDKKKDGEPVDLVLEEINKKKQ